jgi:hypothetical protein
MLLLEPGSPLHAALAALATDARLVFVAGLPGTGKSLLIHQLAHLAHEQGRAVSLLQWDVARPVLEESPAARAYPAQRGVTHGIVRVAVGRWAREAVARWGARHAGSAALLIGETPLAGHRLVELVRPMADAAELLLTDPRTRFVIPVPSRELRRHLEAERGRRAARPLHPREREDAPPEVLRDLWRQLARDAAALGLAAAPGGDGEIPYDPALYIAVYRRVLCRRHVDIVPMDTILPAASVSPYDLAVSVDDLRPAPDEVAGLVAAAARDWADPAALQDALDHWYATP